VVEAAEPICFLKVKEMVKLEDLVVVVEIKILEQVLELVEQETHLLLVRHKVILVETVITMQLLLQVVVVVAVLVR
tara:strand:+ start:222 stop:449 length:228 start_codon:yes stop_codon:yes gene_type:complete